MTTADFRLMSTWARGQIESDLQTFAPRRLPYPVPCAATTVHDLPSRLLNWAEVGIVLGGDGTGPAQ
ncbi:MAG TPA: hypothetical protein VFJ97_11020 [Dermatophilaceae bacterium]|nr:hypothetical protein [Dermatophilaceae bacterium]